MDNYQDARVKLTRVKLTNSYLNKLKSATRNKTETTLRLT